MTRKITELCFIYSCDFFYKCIIRNKKCGLILKVFNWLKRFLQPWACLIYSFDADPLRE